MILNIYFGVGEKNAKIKHKPFLKPIEFQYNKN